MPSVQHIDMAAAELYETLKDMLHPVTFIASVMMGGKFLEMQILGMSDKMLNYIENYRQQGL